MAVLTIVNRSFLSIMDIMPRMCAIGSTKMFMTCPTPILHKKKSVAEELGLPDPPQRPQKPFLKFLAMGHKSLPHLSFIERVQKLSESWNSQTNEEKAERLQEYYEDKEEYQLKYRAYLRQLSPQQVDSLVQAVQRKQRSKECKEFKKEKKLELERLGKPKLPESSFILFLTTLKQSENETRQSFVSSAGGQWKELPPQQREHFILKAKLNSDEYYVKMTAWEERMVKEGRSDLLRKKSSKLVKASEDSTSRADQVPVKMSSENNPETLNVKHTEVVPRNIKLNTKLALEKETLPEHSTISNEEKSSFIVTPEKLEENFSSPPQSAITPIQQSSANRRYSPPSQRMYNISSNHGED